MTAVPDAGAGISIISDGADADPDSAAEAFRDLVRSLQPGQRSVVVIGDVAGADPDADPESVREEHDRLGRLAVRLNIGKLVVVGDRARHIHLAAGLEGSWDGESVLVHDVDAAYDLLCEELRPGDVVLVTSSTSAGLRVLGERLGGVTSE